MQFFLILMGQSSGHSDRMEGGLNAEEISVRFVGSQPKIRNTTVNKLGPKLKVVCILLLKNFYSEPFIFVLERCFLLLCFMNTK